MTATIQVRLTDQRCDLGDAYAQKHWTTPPKIAVLSCEGMCLRGEVARRAPGDVGPPRGQPLRFASVS